MASSKFSSPFFKKSPLHGAYASGADGMVTVSDAEHFAKLQGDAAGIVDKAYTKDKCDDPNVVQYTENSVLKKCPKKTSSFDSIETMPSDLASIANQKTKIESFKGASLSNYKKSNKTNPYYINNGYESPYTVNLPDNFND